MGLKDRLAICQCKDQRTRYFFCPSGCCVSVLIYHCPKLYRNPKEKGTSLKVPAHMLKYMFRCTASEVTSCFIYSVRRWAWLCGYRWRSEAKPSASICPGWPEGYGSRGVLFLEGKLFLTRLSFPKSPSGRTRMCCLFLRWQHCDRVSGPSV